MAIDFYPEPHGLPQDLLPPHFENYVAAVKARLVQITGDDANAIETGPLAPVIGMLLLDEQFYPSAGGFDAALKQVYFDEYLGESPAIPDQNQGEPTIRNSEIFQAVRGEFDPDSEPVRLSYQQFAYVARYVISRTDEYPFGHPNFATLVGIGVEEYISGKPAIGTLELPPLAADEGAGAEIEPDNIRAVAMVYAGYQLDRMKLFYTLSRLREQWNSGLIPTGLGNAGAILDRYDRTVDEIYYNEAQRFMHYSRILGVPGGDVSREVQPNVEFNELFMRFITSLHEYDRQRRIGDLFDRYKPRHLTISAERIRKAGRDVAANTSLYGYGAAHFAARRINEHVAIAFEILDQAEVKQAYGVKNAYQVIERQAAMDSISVNIVQTHTLTRSGKLMLDLVAKYHHVWAKVSDVPLFSRNGNQNGGYDTPVPDIPDEDRDRLLRNAEHFLAVQGVKHEQLDRYAEPEESAMAPSLPAFGRGILPTEGNGRSAERDALLERLSRGEVISPEEARSALLPGV